MSKDVKEVLGEVVDYFVKNSQWLANPKRANFTSVNSVQNYAGSEDTALRVHMTAIVPRVCLAQDVVPLLSEICSARKDIEFDTNTGWFTIRVK